jgi:type VII secretion-associated serine protease mycosin
MRNHLRRYAIGALAVSAVAGAAAFGIPGSQPSWQPVSYGLTASPAQLLPANVSTADPVRVVSTALDGQGRPVVTSATATDEKTATALVRKGQQAEHAVSVELDQVVTALGVPTGTDTYRSQQWDFAKIRIADAWQRSTGAGVTVAVIDTGVEAAHPDLAGHVLAGKDYVAKTEGVSSDPNGHGTHVAGTIAAVTGNGTGVSAIAPDTKILPIRVLAANGSGSMADAAAGIIWAADHGANVVNMSLGSTSPLAAMTNAITYARSKGVTVIAAAGNERAKGSPTSYPAADAGVIAVAATESNDAVASYSNKGNYVDVAAPGSLIWSTVPVSQGSYQMYSGTSMAAPHVAAVAALLKAYSPALTPDQIEQALESSAVDLGAKGKDNDFGYGRIDAAAALTAAAPKTSAPTTAPTTKTPTTKAPTTAPTTKAPTTPAPTKPTPAPTKTTTAPKVTPTVRAASPATQVPYGSTATAVFTVTAAGKPYAGKPVRIGVAPSGGAYTYTDATTNDAGQVVVTQPATKTFQLRLVVPASDTTNEASSPVIAFVVRTLATVTSPAKGALKVALAGALGQNVQVQRFERGRWIGAGSYQATAAEYTMTGLLSGTNYRIVVPTLPGLPGLTSSPVRVA